MAERFGKLLLQNGVHSLAMEMLVWAHQIRDEPELQILPKLLRQFNVQTAIDVGAADGIYSWVLSKHVANSIAIEPNPESVQVLRRNKKLGTVLNAAASNLVGKAILHIPLKGGVELPGWASIGGDFQNTQLASEAENRTIEVDTVTIDSLSVRAVGFIKIDVEGHDLQVVEGAKTTILRDRPVILIERNVLGADATERIRLPVFFDDTYEIMVLERKSRELRPLIEGILHQNVFLIPKSGQTSS